MIKAALVLVFAHYLCTPSAALKDCKQSNDYVKSECGEADKSLTCCNYKQACIGPVKIKDKDDAYKCSESRKLSGAKAMKIVLMPLIFGIMDILFVVYILWKLDKKNHVNLLCVAAIAVSWPLLLSALAKFAIYSAFLALLVAYLNTCMYGYFNGTPRWIFRIVWAMQIFQVVLLFGPNEAFHVPIYKQSLGANTNAIFTLLGHTEQKCDEYYGNFFKLEDIERNEVDANPDQEYYGLCTVEFIGFVQTFSLLQGIVWMVTALVSAPVFLPSTHPWAPATKEG